MNARRSGSRIAAATLTLCLGTSIAACGTADNGYIGEKNSDDPIKVVASTTQICDYVKELKVDQIDLTCLLAPNASAHELEMTHDQLTRTSEADLMMVNGVDLEHFLDNAVDSSGFNGTMLVTSGVLTADDVDNKEGNKDSDKDKDKPYTIDRGEEQIKVERWPFDPEPGEEAEFTYDPHVWTSPKNAMVQVKNIGTGLEKAAEERNNDDLKKQIEQGVDNYTKKLEDLDSWAHKSMKSVDNPVLFTSHDAFGYFSNEFGVRFIGSALSDFSGQQDATAEHIKQAAKTVKDSGAKTLFAENSNNSKSIEAIARAAGVKAIVGNDALYGDSLGPKGTPGETYVGSIVHNIKTLVDAWDGKLAKLPDFEDLNGADNSSAKKTQ